MVADTTTILPFLDQARKIVYENNDNLFATWHGDNGQITDQYTFGQLWEEAGTIAYYLRIEEGLKKGDRVVLCYNFGLSFFASFLGCLRAGITAILVYPPNRPLVKSLIKMNKVIKDCEPKLILTDSDIMFLKMVDRKNLFSKSRHLWPQSINYKDTTATKPQKYCVFSCGAKTKKVSTTFDDETICPQDLAFLQYTSGSTGDPKGVMVTFGALTANVHLSIHGAQEDFENTGGIPKKIVGCSWLPQYHDMGLIYAITAPFVGGWRTHLMSPIAFIKNPLLWLQLMSKYEACWGVAPDFGYRLVARKFLQAQEQNGANPIPDLNLSSLRYLQNAAEPIRPETKALFETAFSQYGLPENWFATGYGLAENVVSCSHLHDFHLSQKKTDGSSTPPNIVAVGKEGIWPSSQTIKIVDPLTHNELPNDQVGELWISGPSVTAGYFKKPELSKEVFQAKMVGSNKTFLRTGDLAFFQDGYLFICGRQKDVIIVNGVNYYPQDVEAAVQDASDKVRPGCVAAFSSDDMGKDGELEVVFEIRSANVEDAHLVTEEIHREIQQKIGLIPSRIVAIQERTIPKTTSGKIQRRATRKALHDSKLQIVFDTFSNANESSTYIEDTTKDAFDNIVARLFGSNFDPEQTWEEMGMSSMTSVELQHSISDAFAITLPTDCLDIHPTPSSLKAYVLNNKGNPLDRKLPLLSSFNTVNLSWFMMGTIQAIGVIILIFQFTFSIVPAWYVGKWLVGSDLTSVTFQVNDGRWFYWMWTPMVVPTWMLSYSLTAILVKWLVVGKYEEGLMDVPSVAYCRWWFVDRTITLWEQWIGNYVKNTPLISLMYYLMGANIHPSAKIDAFIREFDLVEIAKGASVEHPIHCRRFGIWERQTPGPTIRFRSIEIGENSVLQGMASPGSTIGAGACVSKQSVLEEGAQVPPEAFVKGNPAFLPEPNGPPTNNQEPCWWLLGILKILWLGFELYHFVAALLFGQILLNDRLPSDWHYTPLLYWFLLIAILSVFSVGTSIILKWVLIGRRRPGHLSNSLWRVAADWAADYHYSIATSLPLVTVTYNSRIIWNTVLMMYGMDIDLQSKVYLVSFSPSNIDLIRIRKSFASTVRFDVKRGNECHHTTLDECSVGYRAYVGPDVTIQRVVVSPYTHVTKSIIQDEPNEQYSSCSILSFCQHEMEVAFWLLLVTVMIFGSFIPAFDIWMSVFRPSSIWKAVPVVALDLALQTLTWTLLASILFLLSTGFNTTIKRQKPWRIPLYIVYVPTSWTVDIWSLQSVLHGSPMFNWYVRLLLGVKIKGRGRTLLFPMRIFDGTCITIADQTIVDDADLTGHSDVYDNVMLASCHVSGTLHEGTYTLSNTMVSSKESGPWRVIAAASGAANQSSCSSCKETKGAANQSRISSDNNGTPKNDALDLLELSLDNTTYTELKNSESDATMLVK